MRDAIGQVFALQVILAFVLLINGYMAYSVNDEEKTKINQYVRNMNYDVSNKIKNEKRGEGYTCFQEGWCYKATNVSTAEADGDRNGTYYTVVTFVNIDIPVINNLIGLGNFLEVTGETRTIY